MSRLREALSIPPEEWDKLNALVEKDGGGMALPELGREVKIIEWNGDPVPYPLYGRVELCDKGKFVHSPGGRLKPLTTGCKVMFYT